MFTRAETKKKTGNPAAIALAAFLLILTGCKDLKLHGDPINIGLIAPLTGTLASSGEAIQRGILLGIEEINSSGGILGRPLELVLRDVQNDRETGRAALKELAADENIAAVFGGIFSPVMVAQLDLLEELEIPLINPWGSMTAITDNGRSPNYAFRVSVSDKYADEFLARYAVEILHSSHPGIIADTSGWGESNTAGLLKWLSELNIEPAGTVRFNQGETDMTPGLKKLKEDGADSLIMVANTREGASIARSRTLLGWNIPIVSHWGISGGDFANLAGIDNIHDIYTLQTISFMGKLDDFRKGFLQTYGRRFGTGTPEEILSPVGVAHGYDGVHLLAMAMKNSGSTEGSRIVAALEDLDEYRGVVKTYKHPFSPDNHDALQAEDYIMTIWSDGYLVPAPEPQLTEKR